MPGRAFEVIHTDRLARFDKGLFEIDALTHDEVASIAEDVAREVVESLSEPAERTKVPGNVGDPPESGTAHP